MNKWLENPEEDRGPYEDLTPQEKEERAEYYRKFPPRPPMKYRTFRMYWVGDYLYYHWDEGEY